jgi:hypothetical protein
VGAFESEDFSVKRRAFLLTLLAATTMLGGPARAAVDGATYAQLDTQVNQAMAGYNAKSSKQFYSQWAVMMKAIETDQAFQAVYVNQYLKTYGTFKSKTIVQEKSVVSTANALLVYNAVFSNKPAQLSVNFIKEGAGFKIQQIRIDPAK